MIEHGAEITVGPDIPVAEVLVEFPRFPEHPVHVPDLVDIPVAERLIKTSAVEHTAHSCNSANIPLADRIVEVSGTEEHIFHVRNTCVELNQCVGCTR